MPSASLDCASVAWDVNITQAAATAGAMRDLGFFIETFSLVNFYWFGDGGCNIYATWAFAKMPRNVRCKIAICLDRIREPDRI